jgi:hypothetical protein
MTLAILILVIAGFLCGCVLALFATLVVAIHGEEQRMSLKGRAGSRSGLVTRRMLSVYVRDETTDYESARR